MRAFSRAILFGLFCALPAGAWALEFGKLQWRPATKQAPAQAHILLKDTTEIDPAGIRARLGVKESYGVAGLTYLPGWRRAETPLADALLIARDRDLVDSMIDQIPELLTALFLLCQAPEEKPALLKPRH